jgi:hypothetical protein
MKVLPSLLMLLSLCLTGCILNQVKTEVNRQINVFGIELYSANDYQVIGGVKASEEPCLRGYERSFDQLEITVGYGLEKKIRKITTRNPGTSMLGISPGMLAEEGERLARQAGLQEVATSKYQGMGINLSLLIDSKGKIFGIIVETRD